MAAVFDVLDVPMTELLDSTTNGSFDDVVARAQRVANLWRENNCSKIAERPKHTVWAIAVINRYFAYTVFTKEQPEKPREEHLDVNLMKTFAERYFLNKNA